MWKCTCELLWLKEPCSIRARAWCCAGQPAKLESLQWQTTDALRFMALTEDW